MYKIVEKYERSLAILALAIIGILALIFLVFRCATLPEQQQLNATKLYLQQYNLYLEQVLKPEITGEERQALMNSPKRITQEMLRNDFSQDEIEMLRIKKQVLTKAYDLFVVIRAYQQAGEVPPPEIENKIISIISQLLGG